MKSMEERARIMLTALDLYKDSSNELKIAAIVTLLMNQENITKIAVDIQITKECSIINQGFFDCVSINELTEAIQNVNTEKGE